MADQQTPPEPTHEPGTAKGGEATKNRGQEPGRHDTGETGAGRPTGKSTARASTGISPEDKNPIDPESPTIPTT